MQAESSAVVEVTSWTFNQEVLSSDMLVMVEFYKPGCGYCKSVWAQATAQLRGKVKLVAVNAAVYTTLSRRYQVGTSHGLLLYYGRLRHQWTE